jgi:hypothetical protein
MTTMRPSRWAALLLMAAMLQHHGAASTQPAPDTAEQEEDADAEGPEARFNAALETWLYSTRIWLTGRNVLNAGNRLARIPETQSLSDTRINITAEYGPLHILIQPRIVAQKDDAGPQTDPQIRRQVSAFDKSTELTQANARLKFSDHTVVLGRELMTWGPGNFRSPSNPFYYDSGRTSPLAATPGIDVIRYTYNMGATRVHAARVFATDQITPTIDMRDSRLLKVDYQGDNYLLSVNAIRRPGYADFLGGFAQYSPNDAWMLFGEFGTIKPVSGPDLPRLGQIVKRVEDGLSQFGLFQQPPKSGSSSVLGAAYTLESGHVLTAEWMHNSGGLTRGEQHAFFRQLELARTIPTALTQLPPPFNQLPFLNQVPALGQTISDALVGVTLSQAPPLLGRDYLWLSVQSNAQDTKQYWRAEWSQSMTDHSGRALLYAEKSLQSKLSAFVALSATTGGAKSDFGAFTKGTLTIGVKLFVF